MKRKQPIDTILYLSQDGLGREKRRRIIRAIGLMAYIKANWRWTHGTGNREEQDGTH